MLVFLLWTLVHFIRIYFDFKPLMKRGQELKGRTKSSGNLFHRGAKATPNDIPQSASYPRCKKTQEFPIHLHPPKNALRHCIELNLKVEIQSSCLLVPKTYKTTYTRVAHLDAPPVSGLRTTRARYNEPKKQREGGNKPITVLTRSCDATILHSSAYLPAY